MLTHDPSHIWSTCFLCRDRLCFQSGWTFLVVSFFTFIYAHQLLEIVIQLHFQIPRCQIWVQLPKLETQLELEFFKEFHKFNQTGTPRTGYRCYSFIFVHPVDFVFCSLAQKLFTVIVEDHYWLSCRTKNKTKAKINFLLAGRNMAQYITLPKNGSL